MISIRAFALILSMLFFHLPVLSGQSFDYETLMDRIREDEWSYGLESTTTLDNWVADQEQDGSWTEFQYGLGLQSGSNKHVRRLWSLARACTNSNHARYDDATYKEAIKQGLQFWKSSNSNDVNWWYRHIDWPKKLGAILILMREFPEYIPSETSPGIDEPEVVALFQPKAINALSSYGEGANMLDFALHYIYRGLVSEDSVLLVSTRDFLDAHFLSQVQSDLSFHEHGPQLHISSYGMVYTQAMVQLATYLSESPAAFDVEGPNFARFLEFVREVQLPSIRGKYWDFSVLGRGVSRRNASRAGIGFANRLASNIDPANALYYQNALDRVSGTQPPSYHAPEYHRHFWESDYTQHSSSNYLFALRSVSRRTLESENGNTENLKANYFSYGANFISVDGDEYYNIMPVWDWSMIPGITFKRTESFPNRPDWGVNFGNTHFVGGVSDGQYGASVLDLNKHGVKAKKSWFFFDNEIICLGTAISDASGEDIHTTLNQCLSDGDTYYSTTGTSEVAVPVGSSENSHSDLQWVRHDKVAYFFPYPHDLRFTHGEQSGSWYDINQSQPDDPVAEDVFKLWVDHGMSPDNESYAYIVVPGIASLEQAEGYNMGAISILSNNDTVQAVYHHGLDICQAVFHQAGILDCGSTTIQVGSPCVLMLRNDSLLSIADPTQLLPYINYVINTGEEYGGKVALPGGDGLEGSTITIVLESDIHTSIEEFNPSGNMFLSPNPAKDKITLDLGAIYNDVTITIMNSAGQFIHSEKLAAVQTYTFDMNIPAGIYFIRIGSFDWETTLRFINE